MAMSDFQTSGLGREQPMTCCGWACKAGKSSLGCISVVAWAEFHGFMVSCLHRWPKLNPAGFQEMPLMKVEMQPHSCDSFHFVFTRGSAKHEHLCSAGRTEAGL